jgi:two-component system chemotaxis response regulator CheY
MALDTKPRLLATYCPTWRVARSEVKAKTGRGRSRVVPGSSPDVPSSSRAHGDPGARVDVDDVVTGSPQARPMSADVLVVDDDGDVRWTVAEILRSAGFSVAEAEDGEVALDLLSTGTYRMVLLDMRMPKRDGVSLIEAVGEVPPVIVHSAYSLDATDRDRLGSRVVDYLHKPVSPQKLLRAVEAVLGPGS